MSKTKYINILNNYIPIGASAYVADLIIQYRTQFNIKPPRKTKLGDYRHPHNGKGHRISINGDLNQYNFLITTIHEFAHLTTYLKHKNKVLPHGKEWKNEFKTLFKPLFDMVDFPKDIETTLFNYLKNAKASSCSDPQLMRVLKRYDKNNEIVLVEDLNLGAKFKLNRKIFVKGKRLRTYYLCKDLNTGRAYRVNGLAEIEQITEHK